MEAVDGAKIPKRDRALVEVTVLRNKNKPIFMHGRLELSVLETAPIGFLIVQVNATDKDGVR